MSDLSQLFGAGMAQGFARDERFSAPLTHTAAEPEQAVEQADPLTTAFTDGFTQGYAAAQSEAEALAADDAVCRDRLALSIARLDETMCEELHQRLHDTVAALCEAAIAPIALDKAALETRVRRAVAMLARADDERVIRLNPADIALLAPRFEEEWTLLADPTLPRGALRIECSNGGVEDGPQQWRQAIAEALRAC